MENVKIKDYEKMIKNKQYKKLINDHINLKIFLTNKQLEQVIGLKNKDYSTKILKCQ